MCANRVQYETANNHDDVFQLIEEDDDVQFTTGFDRKSIMEESKGKVKVLIVDYNKLGLKRENLLGSLREWFDEVWSCIFVCWLEKKVKNDTVTEPLHLEEERILGEDGQEAINHLFAAAQANKDKLTDLHSELVDFFKEKAIPTTGSAQNQEDAGFLQPMVEG